MNTLNAFFKTLFGDVPNIIFVGCIVVAAALLVHFGGGKAAAYAIPLLLLAGTAWFARK